MPRMLTILGLAFVLGSSSPSRAQEFPSRPIRIVNPYPAGGPVDGMVRLLAEEAGKKLGQTLILENRPGASTLIGTRAVAEAPADGYTLLVQTPALVLNTFSVGNVGYGLADFVAIAPVGGLSSALVVPAIFPVRTLAEFIARVKVDPGKYNYGTLGGATPINLLSDRFLTAAGLDMVALQYKGGADGLNALLARDVAMHILGVQIAYPQVEAGNLTALAVIAEQRHPKLPDVPTFAEAGMPEMSGTPWTVLFARANTPSTILDKLRRGMAEVVVSDEYRSKVERVGGDPWAPLGEALHAFIARDTKLWEMDMLRMGARAK
jgi:tripartite-type tricarboxylate transporter receptor subunit TctC